MLYVARHSGCFCFSPTTFLTWVPSEQISLKSNFKEPWKQTHTYILRLQYCGFVQTTQTGRGRGREGVTKIPTEHAEWTRLGPLPPLVSVCCWRGAAACRTCCRGRTPAVCAACHTRTAPRTSCPCLAAQFTPNQSLVQHQTPAPYVTPMSCCSVHTKPVISSTSNISTLCHAHVLLLSSHQSLVQHQTPAPYVTPMSCCSVHTKPVISSTSNTSTLYHTHVLLLSSHQTSH